MQGRMHERKQEGDGGSLSPSTRKADVISLPQLVLASSVPWLACARPVDWGGRTCCAECALTRMRTCSSGVMSVPRPPVHMLTPSPEAMSCAPAHRYPALERSTCWLCNLDVCLGYDCTIKMDLDITDACESRLP